MGHLFNVMNYFSSLRPTRSDDTLTGEWKAKQRRAWASLLFLALGFGVSLLLANALDALAANSMLGAVATQVRPTAAYVVGMGLPLMLLFAAYSWWSVVRFAQKHGVK